MPSLAERMARLIVPRRAALQCEPPLDRLRARYRTAAEDFTFARTATFRRSTPPHGACLSRVRWRCPSICPWRI